MESIKNDLPYLSQDYNIMVRKVAAYEELNKNYAGLNQKVNKLLEKQAFTAAPTPSVQRVKIVSKSYASIAASASGPPSKNLIISGKLRETPKLNPMVIFYPNAPEGKTSDETQKLLHSVLNPKDDGFKVVRSSRVKGAGKKATDRLAEKGLKSVSPTGKLPKIVLYDVPRCDPEADKELFEEIFTNNLVGKCKINLQITTDLVLDILLIQEQYVWQGKTPGISKVLIASVGTPSESETFLEQLAASSARSTDTSTYCLTPLLNLAFSAFPFIQIASAAAVFACSLSQSIILSIIW